MVTNVELSTLKKSVQQLYNLKTITRYNTRARLKDESVAEHIAFVALIVIELKKYFDFNLERALLMALLHDISEIKVSDVPHDVKSNFPAIKKAVEEAEIKALEDWQKFQAKELVEEFEERKTIEANIVKMADALSVVQYATNEIELGNTKMKEVLYGGSERVKAILDDIRKTFACKYPKCSKYDESAESYCCSDCAWDDEDYKRWEKTQNRGKNGTR